VAEPRDDESDFQARRVAAKQRLDELTGSKGGPPDERLAWFETVYATADRDPAGVPWADLAPKPQLVDWLNDNPGEGRRALDIACGLGDNAEAFAAAGYQTTAFDLVAAAIDWAKMRFAGSPVEYRAADLFDPPPDWRQAFDLVHECYTIQALPGDLREKAFAAIAGFVRPGGRLLVITRTRPDGAQADGPPWPLAPAELARFETFGFIIESRLDYHVQRDTRSVPHSLIAYRREERKESKQ
jgi:SAM-dependent methyltransferase